MLHSNLLLNAACALSEIAAISVPVVEMRKPGPGRQGPWHGDCRLISDRAGVRKQNSSDS